MDVLHSFIQNSSLNGMPKWYKAATLLLFSIIITALFTMLFILLFHTPYMNNLSYGY